MKDVAGFFIPISIFCPSSNDLYYIPNLYSVTFLKGGGIPPPPTFFDYGNGARIASDL